MADDPTTSPTRPAHAGPGIAAAAVRRTHRALLVSTLVLVAASVLVRVLIAADGGRVGTAPGALTACFVAVP